ncbi:EVI5-like protein isoform X3 [Pomacea canaliculata]|uniref:EVI5-like protein isoform X3 n=1 Tax=Pomacea canaliculata TaxID=400727 RepID=UPI000D72FA08|nr:EVI5-like protein isoform X3 [Pomacea canaliculata]
MEIPENLSQEQKAEVGEAPSPESCPDQELLAKLEEANRMLEMDEKAFPSLSGRSPTPGHSRKGSGSSLMSTTSSNSQFSNQLSNDSEDAVVASCNETIWEVWGHVVNDWDNVKKKVSFLRDLVRKGIPHEFRGMAWQLLLGVHDSPDKQLYAEYMKKISPSEKLIRRDIARTFPEHEFFKEKDGFGQESLFNVMKAYSLHDREVGYCQGSGFIVGLLLMQMPEEDAFAVMVRLMQGYRLRELFKPSMAELGLCMYKLEYLIQDQLPALQVHFHTQSFDTSMYASSWFLTLFTTSLPLSLARRIMDLFISEGMEMVFRVAVAILQTCQEDLLALDMEGLLKYLQKDLRSRFDAEADQELLLQTAFQGRYSSKKMKRLEKDYTALKSKENEEQIELRRLRTENRLLRQRIENLEKESASLADKLIQDQVTRAQEAEETYALKKHLSITRQQLKDTQTKLQEAESIIGDIRSKTSMMQGEVHLDAAEEQNLIQHLQEELIAVRLREAESVAHTKELRNKIRELEDTIVRLQRAPSNDVEHLQEELIAVKLREAEANLSLKELRQKVNEIETYWEAHMERRAMTASPKEKSSKAEVRHLQEEVMTIKLREARVLTDLKETKQKVMELETQNQICQNQIRRMDDDNKTLRQQLAQAADRERDLRVTIKELERKLGDVESTRKEEAMMARIKEAESVQLIAELRQKIAEIDIQREEMLAAGQFQTKMDKDDLESQLYDLQDQVIQLKMSASSRTDSNFNIMTASFLTQHDSDEEWDVEVRDSENLDRTLSDIIEGRSPFSTPSKPIPRFDSLDGSGLGHLFADNEAKHSSSCSESLQDSEEGNGQSGKPPSSSGETNIAFRYSAPSWDGAPNTHTLDNHDCLETRQTPQDGTTSCDKTVLAHTSAVGAATGKAHADLLQQNGHLQNSINGNCEDKSGEDKTCFHTSQDGLLVKASRTGEFAGTEVAVNNNGLDSETNSSFDDYVFKETTV